MTTIAFAHGYAGILPCCPTNASYCRAYIEGAAQAARDALNGAV